MSDAAIHLRGLVKRFTGMDKPAVARLDCEIRAAGLYAAKIRPV